MIADEIKGNGIALISWKLSSLLFLTERINVESTSIFSKFEEEKIMYRYMKANKKHVLPINLHNFIKSGSRRKELKLWWTLDAAHEEASKSFR